MESGVWNEAIAVIQKDITRESFDRWIKPIRPISFVNDHLQLGVPNPFFKERLEENYQQKIGNILSLIRNKRTTISFAVSPLIKESYEKIEENELKKPSLPSNSKEPQLNPKYTFDSFVVGGTNQFAHAASMAVSELPGKAYNPLFIYGGVGLGKTHLMHAIGHTSYQTNPKNKIVYVSSEQFTNEFIDSIRYDRSLNFKAKYRTVDVLLVDDIQFFENKESTQDEFFHTFNTLYENQKQIVLSSDRPPREISTLEDRLRSRFECGLITDIQPPTIETRIAILRKLTEDENVYVPDDVIHYIATKIKVNIRELEGALISLIAYASFNQKKIDLSLTKDRLATVLMKESTEHISLDMIQKKISKHFKIQMADLKGKKRTTTTAYPRMIAMYLARELTTHSFPEIGREFGNRDHTTVIHAHNKIKSLIEENHQVKNTIEHIIGDLKMACG